MDGEEERIEEEKRLRFARALGVQIGMIEERRAALGEMEEAVLAEMAAIDAAIGQSEGGEEEEDDDDEEMEEVIAHYESSEGHARCLLSLVKRWHGEATELTNRLEKALGTNPTHADPPMVLRLSARLRALRSLGVHASAVLHRSTLLEASMPVLDDDDGITTLRQRVVSVRSEVQSLIHGLLELAAHTSILTSEKLHASTSSSNTSSTSGGGGAASGGGGVGFSSPATPPSLRSGFFGPAAADSAAITLLMENDVPSPLTVARPPTTVAVPMAKRAVRSKGATTIRKRGAKGVGEAANNGPPALTRQVSEQPPTVQLQSSDPTTSDSCSSSAVQVVGPPVLSGERSTSSEEAPSAAAVNANTTGVAPPHSQRRRESHEGGGHSPGGSSSAGSSVNVQGSGGSRNPNACSPTPLSDSSVISLDARTTELLPGIVMGGILPRCISGATAVGGTSPMVATAPKPAVKSGTPPSRGPVAPGPPVSWPLSTMSLLSPPPSPTLVSPPWAP